MIEGVTIISSDHIGIAFSSADHKVDEITQKEVINIKENNSRTNDESQPSVSRFWSTFVFLGDDCGTAMELHASKTLVRNLDGVIIRAVIHHNHLNLITQARLKN